MLQQLARDFAEDEIKPNAGKWDSNSEFPKDAIKKASDSGLLTLKIPEKYGGCLLYTSPSPRDATLSRMPSSA